MKIVFTNAPSTNYSFVDNNDGNVNKMPPNCSMPLFGKSIIIRNISILNSLYDIESLVIPKKAGLLKSFIQSEFENMPIIQADEDYIKSMCCINDFNNEINLCSINKGRIIRRSTDKMSVLASYRSSDSSEITMPHIVNDQYPSSDFSNLQYSQKIPVYDKEVILMNLCNTIVGNNSTRRNLEIFTFQHPWEFLDIIHGLLKLEIKATTISTKATVAKTAIIEGPCLIEDDVVIDDFAKIKGPVYIGKGSFIGMGSLIRNSMLGYNTTIGFNCEIGKSYFAGNAKISHHNVILDSIIGKNVWFGGYSGTANVLLTRKNIHYNIKGKLIDTGRDHFGAVVSTNCSVGASVIILPGRKISPGSIIPAGLVLSK